MTGYLVFAITYSFACVVQPGPFQAFLLSQSLTNGWKKTIPLVFAPLISDIPVIILVLFVLTKVPGEVLIALQCAGGIFLIYLAFKAFQTWRTYHLIERPTVPEHQNLFKAVLVNLLNPNPYIGWSLVMGPILLKAWGESRLNGAAFLVSFYGSMMIYSVAMTGLFSAARGLGPRITRISVGISAIALGFFGIYQVIMGVKDIF